MNRKVQFGLSGLRGTAQTCDRPQHENDREFRI